MTPTQPQTQIGATLNRRLELQVLHGNPIKSISYAWIPDRTNGRIRQVSVFSQPLNNRTPPHSVFLKGTPSSEN